ncbi:MAG TPA: copper resistance protein CopC, partial [Alphaproteobacteria bacterium]|nr:copper resistance protein CopC [Alphaproteobacteria bacterium]
MTAGARPRLVWRALSLLLCILLLASARDAHSHAVLLESVPMQGATLEAAPQEIMLRFNEPVAPVALRLLDAAGQSIELPPLDARADSTVRVALADALRAGTYLVSWRVVSADSHPIGGSFAFSVGAALSSQLADGQVRRESAWKLAVIVNRTIGDAALLIAAGGALALALVFRGTAPHGAVSGLAIAVAVALAAATLSVPLARGWIAAAPAASLFDSATWSLGTDAPHGARIVAIVFGLLCVGLGLRSGRSRWRHAALIAGALIACAGVPLSGHVAALVPAWPGQVALFLHAAGAAFWLGALPLLALSLGRSPPAEVHRLLRRFSAMAIPVVAALVLMGVGVALTRISSVEALLDSAYGRILLAKVALAALMLALAAANRRLTQFVPAGGRAVTRLRRNVRLEIGCAAAILTVTAWLGHTRPPADMLETHTHTAGRAFVAVDADCASVLVEVFPGKPGTN